MNRFTILSIVKHDDCYGSAWIRDNDKGIRFWIDFSLMDGFGNKKDFKTDELYANWDFNEYIFLLDNENDLKLMNYQQNSDNLEALQEFIDENNEELVNTLKEA